MVYPFCLPIVYHGLIVGHTRKNQIETVNILLNGKYEGETITNSEGGSYSQDIKKEEISKYVNGNDCIPEYKLEIILSKRQEMQGRVQQLELDSDMEFVVSAFHERITKASRLNNKAKEYLENIIFIDKDWVKYVAEALLMALPYSAETKSFMTKEVKDYLHALHLQPGTRNLFRLTGNEAVHYQIAQGIPEHITDEVLLNYWEGVTKAELEHPGTVSQKLLRVLEQMEAKDARAFSFASAIMVNQLGAESYFLLDTSGFSHDITKDWLFDAQTVVSILQECGLVKASARRYDDAEGVIFSNSNHDLCVFMENDDIDKAVPETVYQLTDAGNELRNILNLKANNEYLYCLAWALNEEYKGRFGFKVYEYKRRHDGESYLSHQIEDMKRTDLLEGFPLEQTIEEAKGKAYDGFMQLL